MQLCVNLSSGPTGQSWNAIWRHREWACVSVSSLSRGRKSRTFSGAGILGCVLIHSNADEDTLVKGKNGGRGSG